MKSTSKVSDPSPSAIRESVEAFPLDEPGAALPFTSRLAREQGWTHAFAARVAREYKRFLYLAATAGHPVSPSEAVDHAWHLHLLYTKSYWRDLCRNTIGQEIHHEPTSGGAAESAKFGDWYARTLESYAAHFHEPPPADIWPDPARHAAGMTASAGRWVDTSRHWVVPRPAWTRVAFWKRLLRKPHADTP